jgi:hypothetical protein
MKWHSHESFLVDSTYQKHIFFKMRKRECAVLKVSNIFIAKLISKIQKNYYAQKRRFLMFIYYFLINYTHPREYL